MQLRIIKPGLLSTVQDLGRYQHLAEAVPVSGAMDSVSARIANIVLGNPENAASIEFTFGGAQVMAESDLLIAYSGEGAALKQDQITIPPDRPVYIPAGTTLTFERKQACRTYLAVVGGWDVPEVLGSRSTYVTGKFGGLEGRVLQKSDLLKNGPLSTISQNLLTSFQNESRNFPSWSVAKSQFLNPNRKMIRIVPAREFTDFTADSLLDFLSFPYKISEKSNRMAYCLEGKSIERSLDKELISTAVCPGTIQVTHNGDPVLLMNDCQVTGGYPRIAQVAAVDLSLCGQLKPGDEITFEYISRKEAEKLYIKQEQLFQQLKASILQKYG